MLPTVLRQAQRTPLIHFLGKRSWPSSPHAPGPHPQAPKEIDFDSFLAKSRSSSSSAPSAASAFTQAYGTGFLPESKKGYDFVNFWEAPSHLWVKEDMSEREIEAIMSGGATDIRTGP